jgi:protoheme IX farnesyltransferase
VDVARDLAALTKPRITLVVLITAAGGMKLAGGASGMQWLVALLGTALVVGSANAFNMWLERDTDGKMTRTRNRPLPAGRLAPRTAFVFATILALVSLPILTFGVNPMTGLLGAVALVSYVLLYTPMKRHSIRALWVGAIPGAIPPLLGFTAITGRIDLAGLALFSILFFWQIPHFIAISIFRVDEYSNAGIKVVPAVLGDRKTNRMMVVYSLALVAATLWPVREHIGGLPYAIVALVLGAMFVAACSLGFRKFEPQRTRWARGVFVFSIFYLVFLFGTLVTLGSS